MPVLARWLPGKNTGAGSWSGTLDMGLPPKPMFEMIAQVMSVDPSTRTPVLSDASRLIAPPAGVGVVSSRVISASDRNSSTGTTSFSVPVTEFR